MRRGGAAVRGAFASTTAASGVIDSGVVDSGTAATGAGATCANSVPPVSHSLPGPGLERSSRLAGWRLTKPGLLYLPGPGRSPGAAASVPGRVSWPGNYGNRAQTRNHLGVVQVGHRIGRLP